MLYPTLTCLFSLFLAQAAFAQVAALTADFKQASIGQFEELLNERYVFPDMAKTTGEHLQKQLKAGRFDECTDLISFSDALTKEAQSITKDKHMRVSPTPQRMAKSATTEQLIDGRLQEMARGRQNTAGFAKAEKLEGNVGYFDLRGFANPQDGAPVADHYMALLATSDAIIIDMRKNGGGSPEMVQYLCSYFFDKPTHLNSLYYREGDRTIDFWTLEKVGGTKMPEVPLFVLTGSYTFSGAEEFSYNMQTQKRATLVGVTTGGGANPGSTMPINDKLLVFMPTGKAINPVTKTNWEGVGVVPEVKVPEAEALDKALELATIAAEGFRQKTKERQKALLLDLYSKLEKFKEGAEEGLLASMNKNCEANLLNEEDINNMGYDYLMRHEKPGTAQAILYCNTVLFPNSANTYDSYAEALTMNGNMYKAVESYRKAVEVAQATDDGNLALFIENLKKAEREMKTKP